MNVKLTIAIMGGMVMMLMGCAINHNMTPITPIDTAKPKIAKNLAVGIFLDNRFPFWPRKEAHPPIQKEGALIKEFEPPAGIKEVQMPMGEVRSYLAHALKTSGRFTEVLNPPTKLTGESLPDMLKKSLETSDYLLVGEVNNFHVRLLGRNSTGDLTMPIDVTLLALPNLAVMLVTGGRAMVLTGGLFAAHDVECVLSLSITVYNVESGNPVTTFRVDSRAKASVDSLSVIGDMNNPDDDWIDLCRRLGEVAVANACNQAIDEVYQAVQPKESSTKAK